mmetsp:Transcript_4020/g.8759  ORF Transcript_4020/g.8759 Transcript_4020/m.8759 type:complete len:82 (-) Transcript_4020:267-512(-)
MQHAVMFPNWPTLTKIPYYLKVSVMETQMSACMHSGISSSPITTSNACSIAIAAPYELHGSSLNEAIQLCSKASNIVLSNK